MMKKRILLVSNYTITLTIRDNDGHKARSGRYAIIYVYFRQVHEKLEG